MSLKLICRSVCTITVAVVFLVSAPSALMAQDLYGVVFDNNEPVPTEKLVLIDPSTGSAANVGALITDCCLISSGVSTIDRSGDIFYFIGSRQSDPSGDRRIFGMDLTTGMVVSEAVLPSDNNYNFLEFDPGSGTLYAVVFENMAVLDTEKLVTINPATGAVTDVGVKITDCCAIPSGISALDASSDVFYFIGSRQSDPTGDRRIFTLALATGAIVAEQVLPDSNNYNFLEIDPDWGTLYGVVFDNLAGTPTEKLVVSITPPDAPISFTATAADPCGAATVEITGFDCFFFNGADKRIDKRKSCLVSFQGDTLTIHDSGGVNDNITWTVTAQDESGNTTETECSVLVSKPGN